MSKKSRPWTRRQRKAIRRRTLDGVAHTGHLAAVFGKGWARIAKRLGRIAREVGGTFAVGAHEDVGDLFAVRKP